MYLCFTIEASEYDASEFGTDHVAVRSDEIWGEQVEIFDRVAEVRIDADDDSVVIRFHDDSEIKDPSWEQWGVVAELPTYARVVQEQANGRIRTLVDACQPGTHVRSDCTPGNCEVEHAETFGV